MLSIMKLTSLLLFIFCFSLSSLKVIASESSNSPSDSDDEDFYNVNLMRVNNYVGYSACYDEELAQSQNIKANRFRTIATTVTKTIAVTSVCLGGYLKGYTWLLPIIIQRSCGDFNSDCLIPQGYPCNFPYAESHGYSICQKDQTGNACFIISAVTSIALGGYYIGKKYTVPWFNSCHHSQAATS